VQTQRNHTRTRWQKYLKMKSNIDIFSDETLKYVQKYIGKNKKVLEVGCGSGDFGLKLMQSGVLLTACDTNEEAVLLSKSKGLPAIHIDFLSIKNVQFDIVIFTRSLHHIHQLEKAIDHCKSLLADGGILIIEDFDLNMIDHNTARWYYDTRSIVSVCTIGNSLDYIENPLETWVHDHQHEHALNTGEEMIKYIDDEFDIVTVERSAYLYRSICGKLNDYKNSYHITKKVLEIENGLIDKQTILPNGLRIVARK